MLSTSYSDLQRSMLRHILLRLIPKNARLELERKTGKSVISPLNAKDILYLDAKNDID